MKKVLWLNKYSPIEPFTKMLNSLNYSVEHLTSPMEVFKRLDCKDYDFNLIISGHRFSSGVADDLCSGIEFYEELRSSGLETPFLLYSSIMSTDSLIESCRKDSNFRFVFKDEYETDVKNIENEVNSFISA